MSEPEDLKLRMLRDMRNDNAASREAIEAHMRAVGRMFDGLGQLIERVDAIEARLLAFRAETDRTLRKVQADGIALENRNRYNGAL